MSAKQILTAARAYLAEHGVNRDGEFINKENGMQACSIGALKIAAGTNVQRNDEGYYLPLVYLGEDYRDAYCALDHAAINQYGMEKSLPMINDQSQSDDEILALFDKAIEVTK